MTAALVFALALTITGLAFLGFYAVQLFSKVAELTTELATLRVKHDTDTQHWNERTASANVQHQGLINKYNEAVAKWNEHSRALKVENQRLSKWKNVADAEVKAEEMIRTARATLEKATADANDRLVTGQHRAISIQAEADQIAATEVAAAKETANAVVAGAKEKAKALNNDAQAILHSATTQAAKTIEAAQTKAEEIGGSAYQALKNAALYERTVKAMKNIIEGYGDEYIIPEQSLLDDLAADFSHTQAGQELKRARECTKVMIRNHTAATCDYVEANRRETAISFVVDAFNGKVDSLLSRAKHDNAGKLQQQIRDAYTLVNFNGKPFKDARITEGYLTARLDELKWAEVAQQLALKEREEQRYVKEQAREEAKAIKEQERALRDAAKEEEMLQKAMERAQEQFEQASGEQKTMYEARLHEMAGRLQQAMERKERARSMAQQTKRGHVYIISSVGSFGENMYKIGLTRRDDPYDRVRELGDSSVPFEFDVHAMILSDDAPALEHQLHKHFMLKQVNKVNYRKEFFRVTLKEIREEIENLGLTTGVKWTMTAEAREYRESLAIEDAIKVDPIKREAWIRRQLNMELRADEVLEMVGAGAEEE